MRAKVITAAVGLAIAVLVPAVYFHNKPSPPAPPASDAVATDNSAPAVPAAPAILHRVAGPVQPPVSAPGEEAAADSLVPGTEEYAAQRKADLYQMGVNRDPAALATILKEVHNSDPGIRQAALSATMDFGSKDAIPTLRNEMAWAEDPQEKADILAAIKYLQLPTFQLDQNGTFVQQPVDDSAANN